MQFCRWQEDQMSWEERIVSVKLQQNTVGILTNTFFSTERGQEQKKNFIFPSSDKTKIMYLH